MSSLVKSIIAGFLAGILAVLVFHQGVYWIAKSAGLTLSSTAWNMAPNAAAFGIPSLANLAFWGGIWGVVYATIEDRLPGPAVVKGLVFGCIFPMLLGSWLIVATLKGQPLFAGALANKDVMRLLPGFLLNGIAFGIGLATITPMLKGLSGGGDRLARR
jgi:hypothetical protein